MYGPIYSGKEIIPVINPATDAKKANPPRSRQIAPEFRKKQYILPESMKENEKRIGALLDDIKRSESLLSVITRRKLKIKDSIACLSNRDDTSHSQTADCNLHFRN